jgi:hypothetical protein
LEYWEEKSPTRQTQHSKNSEDKKQLAPSCHIEMMETRGIETATTIENKNGKPVSLFAAQL